MKATTLLRKAKNELGQISLNPYQESLWILSEVTNLSLSEIYLEKENINKNQQEIFWSKIQKRKQSEPLEYILREKNFFETYFYIEKGVFIPRQETETLIHWIIKNIQNKNLKAVDFGAGVGTLCLPLLSSFTNSQFVALEISRKALKCLKTNRKIAKMEERLDILQKDICQVSKKELVKFLGKSPDLIVANPPYIDPKDKSIHKEVYDFEPPLALFSDKKGLGHIFSWFKKAMELLDSGGIYIFEFGWNQWKSVKMFCEKQTTLQSYEIYKDQLGHPRMAVCFKN